MTKEILKFRVSLPMEFIFDDIAERLQDEDALDMGVDAISEKLTEQFDGFFEFYAHVTINTKTKEILAISGGTML